MSDLTNITEGGIDIEQRLINELPKSTLFWFFTSIGLAQLWVIYLTFYNSRVLGLIVTAIANKFLNYGHIKFGSFSFSVLSGKLMIRDFHLITEDYSIRVHYGFILFKWWRKYTPKEINEDLSHLETRVVVFLDGFEFHVYNRSGNYANMEKLFRTGTYDSSPGTESEDTDGNFDKKKAAATVSKTHQFWRDLIPVTKIEISCGRCVFGNQLVPNTLIVHFEEGQLVYTTKPASTQSDQFMHYLIGKAENFKVMFVPSPKYAGPVDEPPRYMGEGFIVLQTREINIHYYHDEPGIVPYEPEIVELADGETVVRRTYPCFGMDIKCGRNTDLSYGPWADRQREHLYKFFYPADYQPMVPTQEAKPGERRQFKSFEFRMSMLEKATIDILFTKQSETQAIHMNTNPGSYVETNVPWVIDEDGYTTKTKGQLLLMDATTSLQYRSLVECETFEFEVTASYPLVWNDHQDWQCDFIACKASVWLIFQHKHFFVDLIEDWSTKTVPDIYHFVPYTWTMNLLIKDFELITLANEYNWIDTSSQNPENAHIAFCGDTLDLSLVLPYNDYLPQTVHIDFLIKGESAFCRLFLPENNTSRHVVCAIAESMKLMDRDGNIMENPFQQPGKKQWRRFTSTSEGQDWIDCWYTSNVALSIVYTYHPMPRLAKVQSPLAPEGTISTPELEEALLIPLRPIRGEQGRSQPPPNFDPGEMVADLIAVELEVAPSILCLYGPLLRNFIHVKENYLGEDQVFTDFHDKGTARSSGDNAAMGPLSASEGGEDTEPFDARKYRPFSVTVSVTVHDIHAHLVKNCSIDDLPCPSISLERLCFELDKNFKETKLQLLLSPVILVAKDMLERDEDESHLNVGHLGLSGLQVRGHAMFSLEGLPLDSETLEYGWLVEAIIGDLTGKLTCAQLQNIVEFLQTFITLVEDPENSLQHPRSYQLCQHMLPQPQCRMLSKYRFYCPSSEDIKYKMTRVSLDSINFFLVESGTAFNVQLYPIKISTCNLHGTNTRAGITGKIEHLSFNQYICASALHHKDCKQDHSNTWLESGGLTMGPIDAEAAMALPNPDFHEIQNMFLKLHDKKTKRLWFLWPVETMKISSAVIGKCGCHGGCTFFGNNKNGIGFFNPRRTKDKPFAAVLQVSPEGHDPGFGQSLLFRDKLVFDVSPSSGGLSPHKGRGFAFTRGYMSDMTSPESPAMHFNITEDILGGTSQSGSTVTDKQWTTSSAGQSVTSTLKSNVSTQTTASSTSGHELTTQADSTQPSSGDREHFQSYDSLNFMSRKGSLDDTSLRSARFMTPPDGQSIESHSPGILRKGMTRSIPSPQLLRQSGGPKGYSLASLESEHYFSAEEDVSTLRPSSGHFFSLDDSSQPLLDSGMNKTLTPEEKVEDQTVISVDNTVINRRSSDASTISYESAPTDQSDTDTISGPDIPDNVSLVDLHSQVNKPITKSPVLLACYSRHLTQMQCHDWYQPPPSQGRGHGGQADPSLYSLSSAGQSAQYVHSLACVPHFIKLRQGFSISQMRTLEQEDVTRGTTSTTPKDGNTTEEGGSARGKDTVEDLEDITELRMESASITTAVVKIKGSMDVLVTPLFLESFQRYVEAVIPTLMLLHPSSIIDGLHTQCLDRLKRQNRLKKGVSMGEMVAEGVDNSAGTERQFSTESRLRTGEMKTSSIQALFTLNKINICLLQAGIVEELISFSALENINELTCVSLLAVSIGDIRCQLLSNSHSYRNPQDPSPLNVTPVASNSPKKKSKNHNFAHSEQGDPENQVSEVCREEDVATLHISRVHLQLQRLLKESNFSNDILLTIIPEYKSKVHFTFDKDFPSTGGAFSFTSSPRRRRDSSSGHSPRPPMSRQASRDVGGKGVSRQSSRDSDSRGSTLPRLFRQASIDESSQDTTFQPKLSRRQSSRDGHSSSKSHGFGLIMFECGLEEVNATAVRRLGFKDVADSEFFHKMDRVSKNLEEIQTSTRIHLETEIARSQQPMKEESIRIKIDETKEASLHSWDSRVSIPSSDSSISLDAKVEPLEGDSSGGVLHLSTIWFNFAAPPPISIKRKVDFTRMDWNLLSSATPAINAWLNPLDRLMVSVRCLILALTHRQSSVMACIMTDALEVPGIQLPHKSKYGKITSLSKTFQEDPSCQLLTSLRKYLHKKGTVPVEAAITADTLPQLITIQKGILALTRQWKNVLYMPQLSQLDFKSRKSVNPYRVTFAMPMESMENLTDDEEFSNIENFDVVDERTSLLQAEGGSVHHSMSVPSLSGRSGHLFKYGVGSGGIGLGLSDKNNPDTASNMSGTSSKYKRLVTQGKSGADQVESPERRAPTPNQKPGPLAPPPITRNDSNYSFHSAATSLHSLDQQEMTPPPTPVKPEFMKQSILKHKVDKFGDLYLWMARQQEQFHGQILEDERSSYKRQDSLLGAFGSGWSQDDSRMDLNDEQLTMATSIMQLADAQSLFKPFLQSIGLHVEGVRPSAMMKKFGGSLSLQGKLDFLKIQIAESDRKSTKGKGKSRKHPKWNISSDTPAFLCEDFSANISMNDVVDFELKESGETADRSKGACGMPLNFAMHKLEAKPTTLQVNFMMNIQAVTQYVDMPLLRLIHQFVTMAENVNDTRHELKQSHSDLEWIKTHRKQDSKDSTSSADTQQSDASHQSGGLSPPSGEMPRTPSWKSGHEHEVPHHHHHHHGMTPQYPHQKSGSLLPKSFKLPFDYKRPDKLPMKRPPLLTKGLGTIPRGGAKSSDITTPPQSLNLSDSVTIELDDTSSPTLAEKTIVDEIKESTPKCWRTLYHLLELYSTMPETKTVGRKPSFKLPVIEEEPGEGRHDQPVTSGSQRQPKKPTRTSGQKVVDAEEGNLGKKNIAYSSFKSTSFRQSVYVGESIPLVVFGIAKVEKVKIMAVLSGLKLESELKNVHASGTYREKVKGFLHRKSSESSVTAHIGHTMMKLVEGLPPEIKTVVTVKIDKSQALYTTIMRRGKDHNSAMVSVGVIDVNIPQHPIVLHDMMTRSSRQITSTLQEFRRPFNRTSRTLETHPELDSAETGKGETTPQQAQKTVKRKEKAQRKPSFLHLHFKAVLQGLVTGASLLPSLKAQHKTGAITLTGMTGKKARFTVDLQKHSLSFKSKVVTTETSIPSQASIDLPPIHMFADYRLSSASSSDGPMAAESLTGQGLMLKEGSYLNAVAEVGMFEHSLTTDLLNHLVFVQKVFMKEVNELVQKVSGSDQPVPLWTGEETAPKEPEQSLLYSLLFRFKGIQITATTPTSSAVQLETGAVDLEISNRVQRVSCDTKTEQSGHPDIQKVFLRAQIDLNLALGQLLKNPLFEEAEAEFQTMAFFKTKIGIRNALQDEMITGASRDQEALLITVTRPIVLAHPLAFDKAVLVWLNYKNAYEYWTEQRMALNTEVQKATRQVMDRLPQFSSASPAAFSTLFLQLTVTDIGICVPVAPMAHQPNPHQGRFLDCEPGAALVLTIKSTQISACSSGSLVSKGKFQDFCLRFAADFETSWDDWKPSNPNDSVMNACVVPEGTYEVCSRTINKLMSEPSSNAKWILNVRWEMQGIDVHIDTNIGKRLSALGNTLTTLAGDPDEEFSEDSFQDGGIDSIFSPSNDPEIEITRRPSTIMDTLPEFVYDTSLDPKLRFRLIETEMNEQAKIVQDLKQLGASLATVEIESKKLEELKGIVFQDFRREVLNKLKKQSESRTSALKDQLGIGNRASHYRSKSYGGPVGRDRKGHLDLEKLASYNQDLAYNRGGSVDWSRTLPATKVQFGGADTCTYSLPETPESLSSVESSPLYRGYLKSSPTHPTKKIWMSRGSSSGSDSSDSLSDPTDYSSKTTPNRDSGSVFVDSEQPGTSVADDSVTFKSDTSNPSMGSSGSKPSASAEPSIDFELDIKVFIDSGKCVLYPKYSKEDELKKQLKREKTPTPETPSSPNSKRRGKRNETPPPPSIGKKTDKELKQNQIENTVFFVPSVDVKVHYNSKTSGGMSDSMFDSARGTPGSQGQQGSQGSQGLQPQATPMEDSPGEDIHVVMMRKGPHGPYPKLVSTDSVESKESYTSGYSGKRANFKRANLYAWISLSSLPEEMVISPCLLDFLEQALEPLPIGNNTTPSQPSKKTEIIENMLNIDLDGSYNSLYATASHYSFPVDVIVFIRVDPSIIRFNCLPVSRVECLLQVPSLELVFSSKGSDTEVIHPEAPKKLNRERNLSGGKGGPETRPRTASTASSADPSTMTGGLNISLGLSDFSLYIFHPYGGMQRKMASPVYSTSRHSQLGSIQEHGTLLSEMARRDMLNLDVEFIKINISRNRKMEVRLPDKDLKDPQSKSNVVRFSGIIDIGTAAFKYDMRRLSEILSFPKAWYRRNLARRLFLGDDSYVQAAEEDWESSSNASSLGDSLPRSPVAKLFTSSPSLHLGGAEPRVRTHHRRGSSGDKLKIQISTELQNEIARKSGRRASVSAPQSPSDLMTGLEIPPTPISRPTVKSRSSISSDTPRSRRHASGQVPAKPQSSWETLVLFAVNLSRLDLNVNMSNVMGNTIWTTQKIKTDGRLSIDSSGHRDLKICSGMDSSHFDSRGGVVGGTVELNNLNVFFEVNEDPELGKEPNHKAGLGLEATEIRLDYMGTSVLMARLSSLDTTLKDEWHVDTDTELDTPLATKRPAFLFAHGDLRWDQFHLMLSRSTTPDIIKMIAKIEEFVTMQFTSSKRVLSAFGPIPGGSKTRISERRKLMEEQESWDIRHHRHWQKALELVSGCRFSMLPTIIPKEGTILGGNMELRGNNLSLACFHGINFKSKSWAIFTVDEPYIFFATEAQKTLEQAVHVVEDLTFYIGHELTAHTRSKNMATICKLSRGHSMPPTFTSVQQWFHYAFATSEVKGLDTFPEMSSESGDPQADPYKSARSRKAQEYNHDTEIIFAFPSLQMHLKTIHEQAETEPLPEDPKPQVDCSFVTEFEDHIFVAMDAEVILFLHDLVSMYIKEKDKGAYGSGSKSAKSPESEKKRITHPTTALKQDWREFECNTWHVEPTVRLLHWASKQIDPVGVDYVLQKLGFTHARVTIPKWMQRGLLDPMDKLTSLLIQNLIIVLKEKPKEDEEED
ncbi:uncharacterized protein KIAA1109-like [Mizuhopecten yessoensis]|uniref:uncharacterized protein KIAA1109-like n=1 Tax=Mizuhopecten yessoensis TaxID=6573 RepID=UPI000B457B93|nr:uncharacterized protein KIAA1109-like [Mizuhopecten yessoensis]